MASPNYEHSNRKMQQWELRSTHRIVTAPWTRRDGQTANPCFEARSPLGPAQFSPVVFAITHDMTAKEKSDLRRFRNQQKRARRGSR